MLFELEKLRRTPDEENFNEGAKAVLKLLTITQVPTNVKEILQSPKIMNLSPSTNIFWFLARGMNENLLFIYFDRVYHLRLTYDLY